MLLRVYVAVFGLVHVPPLALRIPWVEDEAEAEAVPVMPRRAAARAKEKGLSCSQNDIQIVRNDGATKLEKEIKNERENS
jgi:hypothetical protein